MYIKKERKRIKDYLCSRSSVLKSLEKKFGKSIEIIDVVELSDTVNEYTFKVGMDKQLRVTDTEEGLLLNLLKLSIDRKNVCRHCDKRETDQCLKEFLLSNEHLEMLKVHEQGLQSQAPCIAA